MRSGLSLAARLSLASALLLPLFLGATGWFLERSHRLSLEAAQAERLELQLLNLLAQAEFDAALEMPVDLLEPRLAQPGSGFYALISDASGALLWSSRSALGLDLGTIQLAMPPLRPGGSASARINGLLRVSLQVLWETPSGADVPLRFTVLETTAPIEADLAQYRRSLLLWLGGSALALLACQLLILGWGLRPLRALAADIARLEAGETALLQRPYPREVQVLTRNLNTLLLGEQQRRERVRRTLGDLAHSLKTPLAVIRTADPHALDYPAMVAEQTDRMEEIVSYQLQRATGGSARLLQRVPVAPVLERLRDSLLKVYAGRGLDIQLLVEAGCMFRGDERDLMEMLGNLMDNACKYAQRRIRISAAGGDENPLDIIVEDDGPGVAPALCRAILQRGFRADSRGEGQGIGLSVTADIAASYQGGLTIDSAGQGGARVRLRFN
ncbi:ATP-binding protein [Haliea salexigens]|uniref:ATP-binding protein n=1 Tax=Haliea salexigens TaxID=287487 RepID=UPI000484CA3C|nr:ATP-binding protein [Haliea salexigens]